MDIQISKKKNIIKNILIVFLTVMLLLTFFSNTIMNYSLPMVSAQYIWGDNVITRIRVSGVVEAVDSYEVVMPESRTISAVAVSRGDYVHAGDVILFLEDGESEELALASEQLEALKNNYTTWEIDNDLSESAELDRVNKLYSYYKELAEGGSGIEALNAAKAVFDAAKSEVDRLEKLLISYNYADAQLKYSEALYELKDAKAAYEDAKAAYKDAQTKQENAQEALNKYISENEVVPVSKDQLDSMKKEYRRLCEEYDNYKLLGGLEEKIDAYLTAKQAYEADKHSIDKKAAYTFALNELGADASTVISYENSLADKQDEIANAEDSSSLYAIYQGSLKKYQTALDNANTVLENAEQLLTDKGVIVDKVTANLDSAQANLEAAKQGAEELSGKYTKEQIHTLYSAAEKDLQAANKIAESAEQDYNELLQASQYSKQKDFDTALANAKADYEDAKKNYDANIKKNDITEADLKKQVEKQQKEVDKLKANATASSVVTKIDGKVSAINCNPGQSIEVGTTVAVIEIVDKGYTVKANVTNEQAKRIVIGSEAKPQYYWGGDISASVESVKTDPDNPSQSKIVTIAIDGETYPGDSITFNIGEKSVYYESVVPNSAIREDSNGKYVLTVEAKSTPLGNRYIARRCDIKVILSDDTKTAVDGIESGAYVITNSTVPIEPGSQVRLTDG